MKSADCFLGYRLRAEEEDEEEAAAATLARSATELALLLLRGAYGGGALHLLSGVDG